MHNSCAICTIRRLIVSLFKITLGYLRRDRDKENLTWGVWGFIHEEANKGKKGGTWESRSKDMRASMCFRRSRRRRGTAWLMRLRRSIIWRERGDIGTPWERAKAGAGAEAGGSFKRNRQDPHATRALWTCPSVLSDGLDSLCQSSCGYTLRRISAKAL